MYDDSSPMEDVTISAHLLDRLWRYERAQHVNSTRRLIERILEEWIQRQEAELPAVEPDANKV
jgi:hypothetical protein